MLRESLDVGSAGHKVGYDGGFLLQPRLQEALRALPLRRRGAAARDDRRGLSLVNLHACRGGTKFGFLRPILMDLSSSATPYEPAHSSLSASPR